MGPAGTITSRMGLNEKRRAEEEEGLIQPHIEERRYERIRRNGLAVFECFKAWAFANPRRLILGTLTSATLLALLLFKLIYHPPDPPSPWRAQCRADFPTHYAFQRPHPRELHSLRNYRRDMNDMDELQTLGSIQPLTPSHPAWPYTGDQIPSLAIADTLAPVSVLVGVFTMDREAERRQLIRATYASHPESRKEGTEGVKVVFVMGQPAPPFADKIALESELYGDLLLLDIHENMNDGKTHAYFAWAAQHAQVPNCHYPAVAATHISHLAEQEAAEGMFERRSRETAVCTGTRQPDYVVKADDDSFIVLSELERRLRVLPREKAYWGLLMYGEYLQTQERSEYMAGEGYALSMDLVKFVGTSKYALAHTMGDEDQRVGDWIRAHPKAEEVVWVTERCWMYDHPKARKLLSHGFMFPDVVQSIRDDTDYFLPPHIPPHILDTWSTVSPYNRPYRPPLANLTISQQIEALTEGSPLSMWHKHNRPYFRHGNHKSGRHPLTLAEEVERAWKDRPTRAERMKGGDKGSTVLVHKVRRDEWWIETALALLGSEGR